MTTENTFEKGQEVWVKYKIESLESEEEGYYLVTSELGNYFLVRPCHLRTTEQILLEHGALAPQPDRTRKFRKGDKVRVVERWGRKPWLNRSCLELGEVYTVSMNEEEEDEEVYLKLPSETDDSISPFFLDLVEPAPEPKYKLNEDYENGEYYIRNDETAVVAVTYDMGHYTLEEAQKECDRLNRKEQEND